MEKSLKCLQLWIEELLLSASTHAANDDRAYDSVRLDDDFKPDGIALLLLPVHPQNQDSARFPRRYQCRWLVEWFFAWLQWKRRFTDSLGCYAKNFIGFVCKLSCQ